MKKIFAKIFTFLSRAQLSLAIILLLLTILRIPNFFEPYWYGDEGIYLTIGIALKRGAKLYAEIVDHKTPLIYFLAISGSQLTFRVLLYFWMVVTTTAFYYLANKVFKHSFPVILATTFFMVMTTLPWFEGHIPNGELFVMGFVVVSMWVLSHSRYFNQNLGLEKSDKKISSKLEVTWLFLSGVLASLGILTKAPALFDAAALFTIGYFGAMQTLLTEKLSFRKIFSMLATVVKSWLFLGIGSILPILLSILYFILRGSGQDYLQFGLLYNFKYAGTWDLGISNPVIAFFFTLAGKVTFLALWFVLLTAATKVIKLKYAFCLGWFSLALVASLLSNRPYPHYFLQIVPPLALCLAIVADTSRKWLKKLTAATTVPTLIVALAVMILSQTLLIMNVGLYQTGSYYTNFLKFLTGQLDRTAYYQSFSYLMKENYQVAARIKMDKTDKMFIWGTNPTLYALSQTRPVGKFTVSFHIEDLGVQEETLTALSQEKPRYIIVMKNQTNPLPGLDSLLDSSYILVDSTEHMIIWKKISL